MSSQWVSFAKPVQKYGPPQREESGNECSGLSFAPRTLLAYGVHWFHFVHLHLSTAASSAGPDFHCHPEVQRLYGSGSDFWLVIVSTIYIHMYTWFEVLDSWFEACCLRSRFSCSKIAFGMAPQQCGPHVGEHRQSFSDLEAIQSGGTVGAWKIVLSSNLEMLHEGWRVHI